MPVSHEEIAYKSLSPTYVLLVISIYPRANETPLSLHVPSNAT